MTSKSYRISRNAYIAVLIIIVNVLSYFVSLRQQITHFLSVYLQVPSGTPADVVLVLAMGILIFGLLGIYDCIARYINRDTSLTEETQPTVTFSPDGSGERISDFQRLRCTANESILVMGIGLTYLSADQALLVMLLDRGLRIRLLMIDGTIAATPKTNAPIAVSTEHFDEYFRRKNYIRDIDASADRLKAFIIERKNQTDRKGRIELRVYPYFIPMNLTIVDETQHGTMLTEFCLPFSDERLRVLFSQRLHPHTFERITNMTEELWMKATAIASDT